MKMTSSRGDSQGKYSFRWVLLTFLIAFSPNLRAEDPAHDGAAKTEPAPQTAQSEPDRPTGDEDPKVFYNRLIKWLDQGVKFPPGKDIVKAVKAVTSAAPATEPGGKKEEPRDLIFTKKKKGELVDAAKFFKAYREKTEPCVKDDKASKAFVDLLDSCVKLFAEGVTKDPLSAPGAKFDEKSVLACRVEIPKALEEKGKLLKDEKEKFADEDKKLIDAVDQFAKWIWANREGKPRTELFDAEKAREGKEGKAAEKIVSDTDKYLKALKSRSEDVDLTDKACSLSPKKDKLGKDEESAARKDKNKGKTQDKTQDKTQPKAKDTKGTPPLGERGGLRPGGPTAATGAQQQQQVQQEQQQTQIDQGAGSLTGTDPNLAAGQFGTPPGAAFDPNQFAIDPNRLNQEAVAAQLAGQQNQFALEALRQGQAAQEAALTQLATQGNQGQLAALEAVKALGQANQNPVIIPPQQPFFPPSPAPVAIPPQPIPPPPVAPPMMGMGPMPQMPMPPMLPPPPTPPAPPPLIIGGNGPSYVPPPRQIVQPIVDAGAQANMELLQLVRQQQMALAQFRGGVPMGAAAGVATIGARINTFSSYPVGIRGGVVVGANGFRPAFGPPGARTGGVLPSVITSGGPGMPGVALRSNGPIRAAAAPRSAVAARSVGLGAGAIRR